MNEEVLVAETQSPESYIYQPFASEVEPDKERVDELMQRRLDLMSRMNESDKMHNAMVSYQHELSEKTRNLVRERRRVREQEIRRKEAVEARRQEKPKEKVLDAAKQYQEQLNEEFDEPKAKIRRRKAAPPQNEKFVPVNGREDEEASGNSEG